MRFSPVQAGSDVALSVPVGSVASTLKGSAATVIRISEGPDSTASLRPGGKGGIGSIISALDWEGDFLEPDPVASKHFPSPPRKRGSRASGTAVAVDPLSSQTKCNTSLRCCHGRAL